MSLKELTADAHRKAETMPFVKYLFSGTITNEDYAKYLFNQEMAYCALEGLASQIKLLDDLPGIQRTKKINQDLVELDVEVSQQLLPSTIAYLNHLETIKDDPNKLMAHIYVRHMGDLYGGQMIAKKVPGSGRFYQFDNADELKAAIRTKLDDSLADEALVCFGFATNLFEELMQ